ncbi:hypothetical protein EPN90_03750 [Patescibacteria group bacterium]|nr:MAG: hypothetical protein EPN90_03750 [Patescibacteria group bacterium]
MAKTRGDDRSFVLAVDNKVGSVCGLHFVCREERTGEVFEAIEIGEGSDPEIVGDYLYAWMMTYKPAGVSKTLVAIAMRRGIPLPGVLPVLDMTRRCG